MSERTNKRERTLFGFKVDWPGLVMLFVMLLFFWGAWCYWASG